MIELDLMVPTDWPVALFFGAFGLAVLVLGGVKSLKSYALYRRAATAQGRVVDMETHRSEHKNRRTGEWETSVGSYLVVEFTSADGAKHRVTGVIPSGLFKANKFGSAAKVLYDPKDPTIARLANFAEFWLESLYYGLSGFLIVAASIGLFFYFVHRDSSEAAFYEETRRENEAKVKLHWEEQIERLKTRVTAGEILLYEGAVESVRKQQGGSGEEYVVISRATLPDGITQARFEAAPISFHPGPGILGKSVRIYVDAGDKTRYQVMLEPVLAELQSAKR